LKKADLLELCEHLPEEKQAYYKALECDADLDSSDSPSESDESEDDSE